MTDSGSININARLLSSLAEHLTTSIATFIADIGSINNFTVLIHPYHNTNVFLLSATGYKYHFESHVYCHDHSFLFVRSLNSLGSVPSIDTLVDCIPTLLISTLEELLSVEFDNSSITIPHRAIRLAVENWRLYAQPSLARDLERAALLEDSSDTNIKLSMKAL